MRRSPSTTLSCRENVFGSIGSDHGRSENGLLPTILVFSIRTLGITRLVACTERLLRRAGLHPPARPRGLGGRLDAKMEARTIRSLVEREALSTLPAN